LSLNYFQTILANKFELDRINRSMPIFSLIKSALTKHGLKWINAFNSTFLRHHFDPSTLISGVAIGTRVFASRGGL